MQQALLVVTNWQQQKRLLIDAKVQDICPRPHHVCVHITLVSIHSNINSILRWLDRVFK